MIGLLSSIAGPLLGGIFAKSAAKKERATALADAETQFVRLRQAAMDGGFNPLTALQATGTAGFNNLPSGSVSPLATTNLVMSAAQGITDWANTKADRKGVQDRFNAELADRQAARVNFPGVSNGFQKPRTIAGPKTQYVAAPAITEPGAKVPEFKPVDGSTAPRYVSPTLLLGDDGLLRANPDDAAELETDLYAHAKNGTAPGFIGEIVRRNLPEYLGDPYIPPSPVVVKNRNDVAYDKNGKPFYKYDPSKSPYPRANYSLTMRRAAGF